MNRKQSKVYGLKSKVSPLTTRSAVCGLRSAVSPRRQAAGFTLLELLIVIALIMVLAGLMIPAFYKVRGGAKVKQRSIEARIIGSAIQTYKLQERKFPAPEGDLDADRDLTYGGGDGDNREVMSKLREADPPVLDPNKLRWDGDSVNANVLDPDGNQFKITLDLNYDGKIGNEHVEYKVK